MVWIQFTPISGGSLRDWGWFLSWCLPCMIHQVTPIVPDCSVERYIVDHVYTPIIIPPNPTIIIIHYIYPMNTLYNQCPLTTIKTLYIYISWHDHIIPWSYHPLWNAACKTSPYWIFLIFLMQLQIISPKKILQIDWWILVVGQEGDQVSNYPLVI